LPIIVPSWSILGDGGDHLPSPLFVIIIILLLRIINDLVPSCDKSKEIECFLHRFGHRN
jgi:hypothetical protein